MERDVEPDLDRGIGPGRAEGVRVPRMLGTGGWEHERILRSLAEPERDPHFELLAALLAQGIDHDVGQCDHADAALGLRALESGAMRDGLLERGADPDRFGIEIDIRPALSASSSPRRMPVNSATTAGVRMSRSMSSSGSALTCSGVRMRIGSASILGGRSSVATFRSSRPCRTPSRRALVRSLWA